MSYTSNRLGFALLMSLGASKRLRRIWFWGCCILILLSIRIIYVAAQHELAVNVAERNRYQLLFYVAWLGFGASLGGFSTWIVAHIVRFVGKHVKDDYRNDELFER